MRLLVIIAMFVFVQAAFSQRTAEGYIIGTNNDSISVTFKLPRSMPAPIMEKYDQPFDHGNGMMAKGGSAPYKEYFWTLEKNDGTCLFINSSMRKREITFLLKQFLNDNEALKRNIEQQFHGWLVDIPSAVKSVVETYITMP